MLSFWRNKAVADGAVSFYIDHFCRIHIAKYFYGTDKNICYDPNNPEHTSRRDSVWKDSVGIEYTGGAFGVILPKVRNFLSLLDDADFADLSLFQNTSVSETQEFQKHYVGSLRDPSSLNIIKDPIICYRGSRNDPRWLDEEPRECSCPQASRLLNGFVGICRAVFYSVLR